MSARKDFAALVEKEIRFQNFLIREARGEINKRLVRVAALESVYKLYTSPNAGEGLHNRPDTFPQKHEIKIDWDKVAKENVAVTWAFEHDPKFADASIGIDATPAPAINDPVPTETAAGVAPAMEEDEAAVPPPSPAASSTITIDEAEIGSENTKGSTTKPRIGECAAGGDVAPALGNQSEPAVASDSAPLDLALEAIHQQGLKELDAIEAAPAPVVSQSEASPASTALAAPAKRVFQQPLKAADVEALEPEQPARKSVKRVVIPKNKLNPAGILETKQEQPPAVLANSEPLFDRVMNLWAETDLDFNTIARSADCSVEMISAFVAKARKHNDPRGFARTDRGKAPVFKKPIEISRADGAPISGASKPPAKKPIVEDTNPVSHHLSEDELRMLGISNGVVVLDFPNRKVIGIRGTFTSQVETMRVLEKLNSGDLLPIALLAKAGGFSSEDNFKMTLPRLAEKLGDIGVVMTHLKGFGVRITRSAIV